MLTDSFQLALSFSFSATSFLELTVHTRWSYQGKGVRRHEDVEEARDRPATTKALNLNSMLKLAKASFSAW
jgi:hypothetical protein